MIDVLGVSCRIESSAADASSGRLEYALLAGLARVRSSYCFDLISSVAYASTMRVVGKRLRA